MISGFASGSDPDDATARVRGPDRAIRFGQDALRALQVVADVVERARVDAEIEDWIGVHRQALKAPPSRGDR